MTVGGTIFPPSHLYKATFGVEWWFAYLNCSGTIIEVSEQHQLREFSTAVPSEGGHINTTVYITEHAFPDWKYNPDDIAGIMIHEATHAWQESVAVGYVVHPGQPGDPSSASWDEKYANGRERQAVDIALAADASGRIHMSSDLRDHLEDYRNEHEGGPIGRYFEWGRGPDFPYPLPPNVP